MRSQMWRHLGPLIAPSGKVGGEGAALVFAAAKTTAPAPEFSQREYVVFLLSMAAEIEHSLMVQYLYSAWSLGGPQFPRPNAVE
jgi:hypothetical protein